MNTFLGIIDFCVRMLPGFLSGAILFFPTRSKRMRILRAASLGSSRLREFTIFLFYVFCGGLAILTLTPRWFHWLAFLSPSSGDFPPFFSVGGVNLIPFRTFQTDSWSLMILLGNIVMFMPFGFFPPLFSKQLSFSKVFRIGVALPLFVECFQLVIGRSFDVDDLILNLLGILLGFLVFSLLPTRFVSRFRPQSLK